MEEALYGPSGFYRRPEGPAGHFRTSVHATPFFAAAVRELARSAGCDAVVDVGAGRGELLRAVHALDPRLALHAVELADRPAEVPDAVSWSASLGHYDRALLVANEWLDAIPVDVVELAEDGPRLVEVDPATGDERLAGPPSDDDLAWLARWWPLQDAEAGERAELGAPRDAAWASALEALGSGVAVAVDYAHLRDERPPWGTLAAYREGRAVRPVPDGSCDLTAHVAIDACAAAGVAAGARTTLLTTQRAALRALGVRGARPALEQASSDPRGYLRALQLASQQAELIDPGGLGRFAWLVQCAGVALPPALAGLLDAGPIRR